MAAKAPPLKELFQAKCDFVIDKRLAEQLIRWRIMYETRDTHAEALNTPLLGVYKLGFYNRDTEELFDILQISREEAKDCIKQSVIPNDFRVASDEFNLIIIWAVYKFINTDAVPKELKERTIKALFFMLEVKFFSSLLRNFLKFGAKKDVMEATIDSLTDKYDIKHPETNTWKLVMEKRAEELTVPGNIHWDALKNFSPDFGPKSVVYVLTDIQTRIRTKIRSVMEVYYELVKHGRAIRESGMTTDTADGETIIKELKNSYENMIASICNRVVNMQTFLRSDYIKAVSKLVANVNENMVRSMLMQFSAVASSQYASKKQDFVDKNGHFVGYHILIANLVQRTYRQCIISKVNLKSRIEILKKAIDLYRSSRVTDPVVVNVKESIEMFVKATKISSRDATNASLKIALIVYIIFMSFDCD